MTEKLKNICAGIEETQKMIIRAKEANRNTVSLERILSELITIRLQLVENLEGKEVLKDLLIELS